MNMKKVLAAVLAVMLAISAMAITAFADDYEIVLSSDKAAVETATASTVVFTIPVANNYGYVTAKDVLTLTLPVEGTYVVTVNGVDYALGLKNDVESNEKFGDYEITFGTLAHSYNTLDKNTCLPQATGVNAYTTLTVTGVYPIQRNGATENKVTYRVSAADFKYYTDPSQNNYINSKFTTTFWPTTQYYDVKANWNDESTSYCWDWNPTDGNDVTGNYSQYSAALLKALKWDATLQNKAAILGAETAKITVNFSKELVGEYYFGLEATYADGTKYELGSNFNNYQADIGWSDSHTLFALLEEPATSVTFDIPVELLYTANYGVFNHYVTIEAYDALHETMMDTIDGMVKAGINNGTLGGYSWTHSNGKTTYYYGGQEINTYWNQLAGTDNCYGNPVYVTSVVLTLSTADDAENVDIETPVESTEEEVDTDDTDNTVDVEDKTEDTNPTTGIALAVVPMMVAAAAVVASKRR